MRRPKPRSELAIAYHAKRWSSDPEYREHTLEERLVETVRSLGALSGRDAELSVNQLLARWHSEYPETLRLTPGVLDMLSYWQGRCRMAVVSNFFVAGLPHTFLERFGLGGFFEFVLDSASVGYRKPGPHIFEAALALAGARVCEVTFIGDRLDLDIIPAHALGMRVLHLDRSQTRPGAVMRDERFPTILHHDQLRAERLAV